MLKKTVVCLLLLKTLYAGDPCPVKLNFIDAGLPSWSKAAEPLKAYPYIGISIDDSTMQVLHVKKGSPADRAGLKVGDTVEAVDEKKTKAYQEYLTHLYAKSPHALIKMKIKRGGKHKVVNIRLGTKLETPLIFALRTLGESRTCLATYTREATAEEKKIFEQYVYDKNRGFDCKNAHKKLTKIDSLYYDGGKFTGGDVIIVRGTLRTLVIHTERDAKGSRTICIRNDAYQNIKWNDTQTKKIFGLLFDDYI